MSAQVTKCYGTKWGRGARPGVGCSRTNLRGPQKRSGTAFGDPGHQGEQPFGQKARGNQYPPGNKIPEKGGVSTKRSRKGQESGGGM